MSLEGKLETWLRRFLTRFFYFGFIKMFLNKLFGKDVFDIQAA